MAKSDAPESAPAKKKNNSGLMIGIAAGAIGGVVIASLLFFMFFKSAPPPPTPEKITIPDSTAEGIPNYDIIKYENITVNPVTTGKRAAVFMISLSFKAKPLGTKDLFQEKDDAVRELITSYLGSRKVEFYTNPQFREVIKRELKTRVGREMGESCEITQVYITYSLLSM